MVQLQTVFAPDGECLNSLGFRPSGRISIYIMIQSAPPLIVESYDLTHPIDKHAMMLGNGSPRKWPIGIFDW
jgi:hypothetical protein